MKNLKKLKKPSVLAGLSSQILTVLVLLDPIPYAKLIEMGLTVFGSTLTIFSILSNPHTKKKGFGDDIHFCKGCSSETVHIYANGKLLCSGCGYVLAEK